MQPWCHPLRSYPCHGDAAYLPVHMKGTLLPKATSNKMLVHIIPVHCFELVFQAAPDTSTGTLQSVPISAATGVTSLLRSAQPPSPPKTTSQGDSSASHQTSRWLASSELPSLPLQCRSLLQHSRADQASDNSSCPNYTARMGADGRTLATGTDAEPLAGGCWVNRFVPPLPHQDLPCSGGSWCFSLSMEHLAQVRCNRPQVLYK